MAVTPMIFFWALLPPLGFFSIFLMAFLWPYLLMYFFPSTKSRKNFAFAYDNSTVILIFIIFTMSEFIIIALVPQIKLVGNTKTWFLTLSHSRSLSPHLLPLSRDFKQ